MISFDQLPALAPIIVLGYCDVDGSSLRTVFSLEAPHGCSLKSHTIELTGMARKPAAAFLIGETPDHPCVVLQNIVKDSPSEPLPVISLVAINAAIKDNDQATFISSLLKNLPPAYTLIIPASTPIQPAPNSLRPLSIITPSFPPSKLPSLPHTLALQDNFLALLHHLTIASGAHARFILTPGNRPAAGEDGAGDSILNASKLGKAVVDELSDLGVTLVAKEAIGAALRVNSPWLSVKSEQDLIYF